MKKQHHPRNVQKQKQQQQKQQFLLSSSIFCSECDSTSTSSEPRPVAVSASSSTAVNDLQHHQQQQQPFRCSITTTNHNNDAVYDRQTSQQQQKEQKNVLNHNHHDKDDNSIRKSNHSNLLRTQPTITTTTMMTTTIPTTIMNKTREEKEKEKEKEKGVQQQQQQENMQRIRRRRCILYVHGICCATEVPIIRRILKQNVIYGTSILSIQINIAMKYVYVSYISSSNNNNTNTKNDVDVEDNGHHSPEPGVVHMNATTIATLLLQSGFPSKIIQDGDDHTTNTTTTTNGKTSFQRDNGKNENTIATTKMLRTNNYDGDNNNNVMTDDVPPSIFQISILRRRNHQQQSLNEHNNIDTTDPMLLDDEMNDIRLLFEKEEQQHDNNSTIQYKLEQELSIHCIGFQSISNIQIVKNNNHDIISDDENENVIIAIKNHTEQCNSTNNQVSMKVKTQQEQQSNSNSDSISLTSSSSSRIHLKVSIYHDVIGIQKTIENHHNHHHNNNNLESIRHCLQNTIEYIIENHNQIENRNIENINQNNNVHETMNNIAQTLPKSKMSKQNTTTSTVVHVRTIQDAFLVLYQRNVDWFQQMKRNIELKQKQQNHEQQNNNDPLQFGSVYDNDDDEEEDETSNNNSSMKKLFRGNENNKSKSRNGTQNFDNVNDNNYRHPNHQIKYQYDNHTSLLDSNKLQYQVVISGIFWVLCVVCVIVGTNEIIIQCTGFVSVLFGIPTVLKKSYYTMKRLQFDSNCMMLLATFGSILLNEFDEAASVAFLFSLSEYLESNITNRAKQAYNTIVLYKPEYATILHPSNYNDSIILQMDDTTVIPVGSILSVRTGEKVPADGIILEGESYIDKSSMTGETIPTFITPNCLVHSGCINAGNAQLIIQTNKDVKDSTLHRFIQLIEDAQFNSTMNASNTEKYIDYFARLYTPIIMMIAILTALVPWVMMYLHVGDDNPMDRDHSGDVKYYTLNALIFIVIACPCSLTISTPITYSAAIAATAQNGIVIKGGKFLEILSYINTIIFDKTGTLTEGIFHVKHLEHIQNDNQTYTREDMLTYLLLLETPSSHPLSKDLVLAVKKEGIMDVPVNMHMMHHTVLAGEGVTAIVNEQIIYVGNYKLFQRIQMFQHLSDYYQRRCEQWSHDGYTVGFVGIEKIGIIGCYCLADTIREGAKETVHALQKLGVQVLMLTGDDVGAAMNVAKEVGIPSDYVHSNLAPKDKLEFIESYRRTYQQHENHHEKQSASIAFCGDGINDAPALTSADIGISLGQDGSTLALEVSDITIMDSHLIKIHDLLQLGTKVVRTIKENIVISLLCKLIVVILTFRGYMTLLVAIAADVGVMLLVSLNGMKLLTTSTTGSNSSSSSGHYYTSLTTIDSIWRMVMTYLSTSFYNYNNNKNDSMTADTLDVEKEVFVRKHMK